jgi:hypothetical protein
MRRLNIYHLKDILLLSVLLNQVMTTLADSDLKVTLKHLAYDTEISERSLELLRNLKNTPELASEFKAGEFHVVLISILFRYPTLKIWQYHEDEMNQDIAEGSPFFLEI